MPTTTAPRRVLPALERPGDALRHLGPNWFAAVMGTGIVAIAAATLPVQPPGLRVLALGAWLLAAAVLVVLLVATAAHWLLHPARARAHLADPVAAHFYGAPPMALLTVGTGALLVGRDLIGLSAAVHLDVVLWCLGTTTGLASALVVPYRAITQHTNPVDAAFGGWLMPVVPPMVSASAGALLVPHVPAGQLRQTLLMGCYAMFGLSLLAALLLLALVLSRLLHHGLPAAAAVPTVWIGLGPLGQSTTAAAALGLAAGHALPDADRQGAEAFALLFGAAMWGFAMFWTALALALTVHAARRGLPFALTWWGFTFPLGTVVTGSTAMAARTGLDLFAVVAVVLFVALLGAWALVASRTARGVLRGDLLLPPVVQPKAPL